MKTLLECTSTNCPTSTPSPSLSMNDQNIRTFTTNAYNDNNDDRGRHTPMQQQGNSPNNGVTAGSDKKGSLPSNDARVYNCARSDNREALLNNDAHNMEV